MRALKLGSGLVGCLTDGHQNRTKGDTCVEIGRDLVPALVDSDKCLVIMHGLDAGLALNTDY